MSEHRHVFTYIPYGDLHDQPNAILMCECGVRVLDAYIAACGDLESARTLIRSFDAAIRRIAAELTGQACGGVDTADEINPETGEPYGPGGHTGWLLTSEARKLREERDRAMTDAATFAAKWHDEEKRADKTIEERDRYNWILKYMAERGLMSEASYQLAEDALEQMTARCADLTFSLKNAKESIGAVAVNGSICGSAQYLIDKALSNLPTSVEKLLAVVEAVEEMDKAMKLSGDSYTSGELIQLEIDSVTRTLAAFRVYKEKP